MTERAEQMVCVLEERGYRVTPQRAAICRVLVNSRAHLTPQAVYEKVSKEYPGISKATVYNTLMLLRSLGELTEIGLGGDETHYEADPQPHANLICLKCGRILDVVDPGVSGISRQLADAHGFTVKSARTDIYGYCPQCRA